MDTTTQQPHEVVAGEVRAALARRRISGRQAARDLGWKPAYIWRRLDGRTPFDVNDLAALAQLLQVPASSLLSGLPEKVTKVALSLSHPRTSPLSCISLTSTRQMRSLVSRPAA